MNDYATSATWPLVAQVLVVLLVCAVVALFVVIARLTGAILKMEQERETSDKVLLAAKKALTDECARLKTEIDRSIQARAQQTRTDGQHEHFLAAVNCLRKHLGTFPLRYGVDSDLTLLRELDHLVETFLEGKHA